MLEVVDVGYILRSENATAHALGLETGEVEIDGLSLIETHIGDSQHDTAILGLSS